MAVSVQKFSYGFEGGLDMFLGTREMLGKLVELLPLHQIIAGDQLSGFPAAADPSKKTSASCAQLWQKSSLINETFRNFGEANLDQIVMARSFRNVPACMLDLAREDSHISDYSGRSACRLSLSHLCAKLCSFAVLPTRNSDRNKDCNDAAYGLDQCGCVFPEADVTGKPKHKKCHGKSDSRKGHVDQHRDPPDFLPCAHSLVPLLVSRILPLACAA